MQIIVIGCDFLAGTLGHNVDWYMLIDVTHFDISSLRSARFCVYRFLCGLNMQVLGGCMEY